MVMQASIRPSDINPAILTSLYRKQFGLCNVQRGETIRIIGAGYWRKGRKLYEKTNQVHE